ncbi:hypothetical protein [Sphingorhabdus sp.]|jgi:hypothetical protein
MHLRDTPHPYSLELFEKTVASGGSKFLLKRVFDLEFLFFEPVYQIVVGVRSAVFQFELSFKFCMFGLQCGHMTLIHRFLLFLLVEPYLERSTHDRILEINHELD